MNKYFKKWIIQAIEEMDDEFTVHQVLEKIVESKGTSMYVGSSQQLGYFLSTLPQVERIAEAKYRKVIE